MKRAAAIVPLVALLGLGVIGGWQLIQREKPGFSTADQRPAPQQAFPRLKGEGVVRFAPPANGQPIAVNLFASWCGPCEAEHPLVTDLAARHPGQIFGLAYKDQPEDTLKFLSDLGDPFTDIGVDQDGQGGLEFGLTGVPETFVISPEGQIIMHVRGPLDAKTARDIGRLLIAEDGA